MFTFLELEHLQKHSNLICEHFGMRKIPIEINNRLKRTLGLYCWDRIELNPKIGKCLGTLRHELAHHLKQIRFEQRVEGFYKMEMWPAMVLDSIDENGQKWYAAKGELHPVYFKVGNHHGPHFRKCLKDIEAYCKHN